MEHIKSFSDNKDILKQIEDYLNSEYTSKWFDEQLSERVYDYISEEDADDFDGNYEEAYKELSTGGAIEYDLLEEIYKDLISKFSLSSDELIDNKRNVIDIAHDHLYDTCEWKDNFIFNKRSTDPYISTFKSFLGGKSLDDDWDL